MPAGSGLFVTLEGGDGTGKSTQLRALAAELSRLAAPVVTTREPGGTAQGDALRTLLLDGDADRWSPAAELLLMNAARVEHVRQVVAPALAGGAVVLCDRYVDSTRAYQGLAGGLGLDAVDRLHGLVSLPWPDLTLLLDLDPAVAGARRASRATDTRFERRGKAFEAAVRDAFLSLAAAEPGRWLVVDARLPAEEVTVQLLAAIRRRLG